MFGESLETVMGLEKDPKLKIPQVMIFLTDAVKALDGKRTQGIFRVPGDADIVTDLVSKLDYVIKHSLTYAYIESAY